MPELDLFYMHKIQIPRQCLISHYELQRTCSIKQLLGTLKQLYLSNNQFKRENTKEWNKIKDS